MGYLFLLIGFVLLFINLKFKNPPAKDNIGAGMYDKCLILNLGVL